MTSNNVQFATLTSGSAVRLDAIPTLTMDDFQQGICSAVAFEHRVSALFGVSARTT